MSACYEKSQPLTVVQNCPFSITPFGVYCSLCNIPIGSIRKINGKMIQKHCLRKNHPKDASVSFNSIAESINDGLSTHFDTVTNIDSWLTSLDATKSYSCSCGSVFANISNIKRHQRKMKAKDGNQQGDSRSHICTVDECYHTVCGRKVNKLIINEMRSSSADVIPPANMPFPPTDSHPTEIPPTAVNPPSSIDNYSDEQSCSIITQPTVQSSLTNNSYIPINIGNRRWITTTIASVREMFRPYKRINEELDPYLGPLKLIVINNSRCIMDEIKICLSYISRDINEILDMDKGLDFFLQVSTNWLQTYSREHVNSLDGKTRFKLQSFFHESLRSSMSNTNFTMRTKEITLVQELHSMIKMSWRLIHMQSRVHPIYPKLMEIIISIKQYATNYDNIGTDKATEQLVESLLLQRYFHTIFVEGKTSAYSLLFGLKVLMMRLFKEKQGSDTNETNTLSMRPCAEFGSIIGTQIHIYRLAGSSLLACTNVDCWDYIIDEISNSALCHIISPLINRVSYNNHSLYCKYTIDHQTNQ